MASEERKATEWELLSRMLGALHANNREQRRINHRLERIDDNIASLEQTWTEKSVPPKTLELSEWVKKQCKDSIKDFKMREDVDIKVREDADMLDSLIDRHAKKFTQNRASMVEAFLEECRNHDLYVKEETRLFSSGWRVFYGPVDTVVTEHAIRRNQDRLFSFVKEVKEILHDMMLNKYKYVKLEDDDE